MSILSKRLDKILGGAAIPVFSGFFSGSPRASGGKAGQADYPIRIWFFIGAVFVNPAVIDAQFLPAAMGTGL
jgi:hypothetical protein